MIPIPHADQQFGQGGERGGRRTAQIRLETGTEPAPIIRKRIVGQFGQTRTEGVADLGGQPPGRRRVSYLRRPVQGGGDGRASPARGCRQAAQVAGDLIQILAPKISCPNISI